MAVSQEKNVMNPTESKKTGNIKGIEVYPFDAPGSLIEYADASKGILVAVNAEKVVNADDRLREIINGNIGYCDGVGAVKALRRKGFADVVRIPGCELWLHIVDRFHASKSFYLIGSTTEVIDTVVKKLRAEYPGINILGARNGFIADDAERAALIDDVAAKKPDVVFVAMGSPRQEFLMQEMQRRHPHAIYQGLGGSFDVYSGKQQRVPKWWIDHNLEFAYRFVITPKRLPRITSYLKYACLLYTNQL